MGQAELARQRLARRVEVDADDLVGAGDARALHDVEADAAEAEDDHVRARLDLRRPEHRADAGRDAAADVADLVERRVGADLGERDLRQHGVLRERRAAHVVVDLAVPPIENRLVPSGITPLPCVARIAVQRLVLRRQARLAGAALGRVERDDVVALLHAGHARRRRRRTTPAPFVAEDRREQPLGIGARARELVGVADAGRLDLDQHLAGLRALELDLLDDQRLARLVRHGRACLHGSQGSAGPAR